MTFAALMVHAHAEAACEPRLRLAADLADQLDACLIGLAAQFYLPPPEFLGGENAIARINDEISGQLQEAEARFRRVCGTVKKGAEWRAFSEPPTAALARNARAAELVICGGAGAADSFVQRQASPADLLMTTGRPVLTGPAEADHLDLRRIVLAWKDSREARRAMSDAMPLLVRADEVLVVGVQEDGLGEDPALALADVAEAIRRHGGQPKSSLIPNAHSTSDAVLAAAADFEAGLIVAGGYGQSRLQEWAFGGVTKSLLRQDQRFVLLSH